MTAAALKALRMGELAFVDLTQAEMADLLGVALPTYQGYENGRPIPAHVDKLIACLKRLKKWGNPLN
mgnify:CR=1 FL=1